MGTSPTPTICKISSGTQTWQWQIPDTLRFRSLGNASTFSSSKALGSALDSDCVSQEDAGDRGPNEAQNDDQFLPALPKVQCFDGSKPVGP